MADSISGIVIPLVIPEDAPESLATGIRSLIRALEDSGYSDACLQLQQSFCYLIWHFADYTSRQLTFLGANAEPCPAFGHARLASHVQLLQKNLDSLADLASQDQRAGEVFRVFYVGGLRARPNSPRRHTRLLGLGGQAIRGYRSILEWCQIAMGEEEFAGEPRCQRELRRYLPILREWLDSATSHFRQLKSADWYTEVADQTKAQPAPTEVTVAPSAAGTDPEPTAAVSQTPEPAVPNTESVGLSQYATPSLFRGLQQRFDQEDGQNAAAAAQALGQLCGLAVQYLFAVCAASLREVEALDPALEKRIDAGLTLRQKQTSLSFIYKGLAQNRGRHAVIERLARAVDAPTGGELAGWLGTSWGSGKTLAEFSQTASSPAADWRETFLPGIQVWLKQLAGWFAETEHFFEPLEATGFLAFSVQYADEHLSADKKSLQIDTAGAGLPGEEALALLASAKATELGSIPATAPTSEVESSQPEPESQPEAAASAGNEVEAPTLAPATDGSPAVQTDASPPTVEAVPAEEPAPPSTTTPVAVVEPAADLPSTAEVTPANSDASASQPETVISESAPDEPVVVEAELEAPTPEAINVPAEVKADAETASTVAELHPTETPVMDETRAAKDESVDPPSEMPALPTDEIAAPTPIVSEAEPEVALPQTQETPSAQPLEPQPDDLGVHPPAVPVESNPEPDTSTEAGGVALPEAESVPESVEPSTDTAEVQPEATIVIADSAAQVAEERELAPPQAEPIEPTTETVEVETPTTVAPPDPQAAATIPVEPESVLDATETLDLTAPPDWPGPTQLLELWEQLSDSSEAAEPLLQLTGFLLQYGTGLSREWVQLHGDADSVPAHAQQALQSLENFRHWLRTDVDTPWLSPIRSSEVSQWLLSDAAADWLRGARQYSPQVHHLLKQWIQLLQPFFTESEQLFEDWECGQLEGVVHYQDDFLEFVEHPIVLGPLASSPFWRTGAPTQVDAPAQTAAPAEDLFSGADETLSGSIPNDDDFFAGGAPDGEGELPQTTPAGKAEAVAPPQAPAPDFRHLPPEVTDYYSKAWAQETLSLSALAAGLEFLIQYFAGLATSVAIQDAGVEASHLEAWRADSSLVQRLEMLHQVLEENGSPDSATLKLICAVFKDHHFSEIWQREGHDLANLAFALRSGHQNEHHHGHSTLAAWLAASAGLFATVENLCEPIDSHGQLELAVQSGDDFYELVAPEYIIGLIATEDPDWQLRALYKGLEVSPALDAPPSPEPGLLESQPDGDFEFSGAAAADEQDDFFGSSESSDDAMERLFSEPATVQTEETNEPEPVVEPAPRSRPTLVAATQSDEPAERRPEYRLNEALEKLLKKPGEEPAAETETPAASPESEKPKPAPGPARLDAPSAPAAPAFIVMDPPILGHQIHYGEQQGGVHHGRIALKNLGGGQLKGTIKSNHPCLKVKPSVFRSNEAEIEFWVDESDRPSNLTKIGLTFHYAGQKLEVPIEKLLPDKKFASLAKKVFGMVRKFGKKKN